MAVTNPNKYVTVRRLNRFRQKLVETGMDASGKADKLPMTGQGAATEDNLMAIDANGNIKDAGKSVSDFAAASHNHDSSYAAKSHNHDSSYAAKSHDHDSSYYKKSQTYTKTEVDNAIKEALINPISDSSITVASTFKKRDLVSVDGTMYLCDAQSTDQLPKRKVVVSGGRIVLSGGRVVITDGGTLSQDWHAI